MIQYEVIIDTVCYLIINVNSSTYFKFKVDMVSHYEIKRFVIIKSVYLRNMTLVSHTVKNVILSHRVKVLLCHNCVLSI